MAEFAQNNAKNANTGYTPLKFNYGYYPCIFFQKKHQFLLMVKDSKKLGK